MTARYKPRHGVEARGVIALASEYKNKFMAAISVMVLAVAIGSIFTQQAQAFSTPMRAMFYYPWFPETWHSNDHFVPSLTAYSSDDPVTVAAHVNAMQYAAQDAAIASWWGKGLHKENTRFPLLYQQSTPRGFGIIPYYEPEGQGDVPIATIQSDLAYLKNYVNANPESAVKIDGKPVIFVYNTSGGCARTTKWKQVTDWYVNMKVFSGYKLCADQPNSWHQYGPAVAESTHLPFSFGISAGFWHHNEATPRLTRDPARWATNVSHLKASNAQWQLSYFNEWGEGTAIESSPTWASTTGFGTYLDELNRQLGPSPTPSPSASTTTSPPLPSPSPSASTTTPSPSPSTTAPSPTPTTPPPSGSITVMAAGDIVDVPPCNGYSSGCQDGWTAELLTKYSPTAILGLGDLQYEEGSLAQYNAGWGRTTCASPSDCDAWGKHINQAYPAAGNHEWLTSNAQGYRDYFAARLAAIGSDTPSGSQMYYSYDLGAWHFIVLDSDRCGCSAGNPMMVWLLNDLAANDGRPTIVYYHHPTWSSGNHGSTGGHTYLKSVLVGDLDVQIVLQGHDHDYERFAPMGTASPDPNGVRPFVVGTGGRSHYCTYNPIPGSQVFNCTTFGALRLVLRTDGYDWQFHSVAEIGGPASSFTDTGTSSLRKKSC